MKVHRICEMKDGKLYTLFHSFDGSRKMEMDKWLIADVKPVRDGSRKTAKLYTSGFHTIESLQECEAFISKFRAERTLAIVECEIGDKRWPKEHSPANIILSDRIKLNKIIKIIKICKENKFIS